MILVTYMFFRRILLVLLHPHVLLFLLPLFVFFNENSGQKTATTRDWIYALRASNKTLGEDGVTVEIKRASQFFS